MQKIHEKAKKEEKIKIKNFGIPELIGYGKFIFKNVPFDEDGKVKNLDVEYSFYIIPKYYVSAQTYMNISKRELRVNEILIITMQVLYSL